MEFHSFISWLGTAAVTILSLFGAGAIFRDYILRRWKKTDHREEAHITNQGEQIRADAEIAKQMLLDQRERIERLEGKFDQLQEKYNSQIEMSAQIEAENKILREKEARQEKELEELKKENHKQATEIINLRNELQRTRADLEHYKREFEILSQKVERLNRK